MNKMILEFHETNLEEEICPLSPLHILIIEDVIEDIELVQYILKEANISLTYDRVTTAPECQQCLQSNTYDAVFSDYRLPNFSGLQAFEFLQQSGQDIPFILITGSLGEESAVGCIKMGMTDYVLKDRLFRLPSVLQRALQEFTLRRQQKAAIAKIQQQAWREAIINRIVQAMRETLVLADVLQTTANLLHEALQVCRCLIFQPDIAHEMRVKYVSESSQEANSFNEITCEFFQSYHDHLVQGEQVVFNQIHAGLNPEIQEAARMCSIRSILITPLLYQETYLGGISLHQCTHERTWTENELSLVKAIADQCAIAIHQSQLYQNAQAELYERNRIEAQLRHDAFHDALTNLPNRALFLDRLNHALQLFQRRAHLNPTYLSYQFALLFLDLDRFKVVNESLGHAAGDQLLKVVTRRLTSCLRAGDTVARLGGDEFGLLLEDIQDVNDAIEVIYRIDQVLKIPISLDGHEVFMSTSIGIVLSSIDYTQPDQLLRDADIAMYRAKSQGRGKYEIFNPSMHAYALKQLHLENDLCRAIARQELRVQYQPIICLQSQQILGFEALVRWQHPEQGLISPAEFIPIAEDTGLIIPIDFWVLQESCRQLRDWQDRLPIAKQLSMSVNLSGKHFTQPDLVSQIDQILKMVNLDGIHLKIEITESVLIENTALTSKILNQLKEQNIQVCIDDFGTGYSSLSYLHRFPIHTLKIDRSFISQLDPNSDDCEIVKAIIILGFNLGMQVVAEGVETSEQMLFLKSKNCHAGQGYYLSRPLDAVAATELLCHQPLPDWLVNIQGDCLVEAGA